MQKTDVCLPSETNVRLNCQEDAHHYAIITPIARAGFSGDLCYRGKGKSRNSWLASDWKALWL